MPNPTLRLDDLVNRSQTPPAITMLLNVKVPTALLERSAALARKLRTSKTQVVIAILNEGLYTADQELKNWKAPRRPVIPKDRPYKMADCDREKVAHGLCCVRPITRRSGGRRWGKWSVRC